jgi:hypothetical protein
MIILNIFKDLRPLEVLMLLSGIVPSFITLLIGLSLYFSQNLIGLKRHIILLTASSFICNFITATLWLNVQPNMHIANMYVVLEMVILTFIYRDNLKDILSHKVIETTLLVFSIFAVWNMYNIQGFYEINSYSRTLESVLMIIFSLMYFYKIMQKLESDNLVKEPMFWLNAGVLLYFSANVFIFVFSSFVSKYSKDLNVIIWAIHAVFYAIFFIMLSTALWAVPQPKRV